ncbi:hypothetical protein NOVO_06365 [Rickettsiales bacterium Ac37b]|nr:hypothetical protein NOVO_06365 [Rickettsiales bacterium Ac37b]
MQPAVTDFGYNYKLIKNELLKNKDIKTLQDKALEITKFIWPGIVAVIAGAVFFGLYINYSQGAEVASSVLLAVGTFIVGSAQMLVKPMIKREVARKNPPAPMVGERELLISPAIQAAEELEQEIVNNDVQLEQLEQITSLVKAQNRNASIKTMALKQKVNEQQTEIVQLSKAHNNLQANNQALTEQLDKNVETIEKLTQEKEQLTQQFEQAIENNRELQNQLNHLQQPITQIDTASSSASRININSNDEISVFIR